MMTTAEERMKILDMIRDGKIKADEGARLLQALNSGAKKAAEGRDPRWLRVRVTDKKTNKVKVNVTLPMSVVNVGIKLGARLVPESGDVDLPAVIAAIRSGQVGKVFEYDNEEEGERIEIWLE
jgi:hypothetical protein